MPAGSEQPWRRRQQMHPGFFHWRRAHACRRAGWHAEQGGAGYEASGDHRHGGPMFGVRRPLRVMAHELELDEDQVERLARLIDELKTGRAQAAVDERKSVGLIADALLAPEVDRGK